VDWRMQRDGLPGLPSKHTYTNAQARTWNAPMQDKLQE